MFDIPVALFIFKRYETVIQIIERLREVQVSKLYLIGDGPRNDDERELVLKCRNKIEQAIDWDCEIIRDYANVNRGVYENIGNGAKRVFQKEEMVIFLEDDNLPEVSFFGYCEELLMKYKDNPSVLWVNGTNYLTKYQPSDGSDYMFTQQLLPCGWASWANKFCKYYDGLLDTINDKKALQSFKKSYHSGILCKQQLHSIRTTKRKLEIGEPVSWDFQMCFSIRSNDMYGISPKYNLIKNIGVDAFSTHGGTSYAIEMTERFCSMDSIPLKLPLKHPKELKVDYDYERRIERIITWPLKTQIEYRICYLVKPFWGLQKYDSMSTYLKKRRDKNVNQNT